MFFLGEFLTDLKFRVDRRALWRIFYFRLRNSNFLINSIDSADVPRPTNKLKRLQNWPRWQTAPDSFERERFRETPNNRPTISHQYRIRDNHDEIKSTTTLTTRIRKPHDGMRSKYQRIVTSAFPNLPSENSPASNCENFRNARARKYRRPHVYVNSAKAIAFALNNHPVHRFALLMNASFKEPLPVYD